VQTPQTPGAARRVPYQVDLGEDFNHERFARDGENEAALGLDPAAAGPANAALSSPEFQVDAIACNPVQEDATEHQHTAQHAVPVICLL